MDDLKQYFDERFKVEGMTSFESLTAQDREQIRQTFDFQLWLLRRLLRSFWHELVSGFELLAKKL